MKRTATLALSLLCLLTPSSLMAQAHNPCLTSDKLDDLQSQAFWSSFIPSLEFRNTHVWATQTKHQRQNTAHQQAWQVGVVWQIDKIWRARAITPCGSLLRGDS